MYNAVDFKPLGGKNKIVEIDEALLGKRHGPLPHGNNNKVMKLWSFGMAERASANIKNCFFRIVPNRSAATLHPLIIANVHKNSWIFSDGWAAYNGLSEHFEGHKRCNHS